MSVDTTARKQSFTLDGVTDTFDFTFRALAATDILAIATTGGTDTNLTYTTDYTVALESDGVGGTLTLVSAASTGTGTLTVYRTTTNKQESDYEDYNQFPADTLEEDLDRRTLVSQELSETNNRTVTLAITASSGTSTTLPTPSTDKIVGWNTAADALENKTISDLGAVDPSNVAFTGGTIDGVTLGATTAISEATITVADGDDKTGLTLTQNDTTNNPDAVSITNAGTSHALSVSQTGVLASGKYGLYLASNAVQVNAPLAYITQINASSDQSALKVNNTGTGAAIELTGNAGIKFPATQGASADANTLDDYEEGYHTATITCATSGTVTVDTSYDQLAYTKIGRKVTVTGLIIVDSVSSPVGEARISLPFTSASLNEAADVYLGSIITYNVDWTASRIPVALMGGGTSYFTITMMQDDGTYAPLDASNISATDRIGVNITYFTA